MQNFNKYQGAGELQETLIRSQFSLGALAAAEPDWLLPLHRPGAKIRGRSSSSGFKVMVKKKVIFTVTPSANNFYCYQWVPGSYGNTGVMSFPPLWRKIGGLHYDGNE